MLDLFYQNRRLLLLATALIVVSGLSSIVVLPRLEDPVLKQRAALIHTRFPGATAVRVESLVTEVLEEALKEIEELRIIRSASRNGLSTITMELEDHVQDVSTVWSRVRDKLNDVTPEVEAAGALAPQFVDLKFSAYAMLIAITWDESSPEENHAILQRYAERLEQKLRTVAGTDDVDIFGMSGEEIAVAVDQQQIAARGMTLEQVATALRASDAKVSAGGLRNETSDLLVEVNSEFDSLARIAATPIQVSGERSVVTLSDVATLHKSVTDPPTTQTLVDGRPGIVIGCFIQPATRIDHWTDDVTGLLAEFRRDLPEGITIEPLFVQERYVSERLNNLVFNLSIGGVAIMLVVLFMMGWRSAIIVGTALPLTAMLVLGGLRLLNIPLHQMSITGLIIALGLLIDNAIVAVDEMRRHLRAGLTPAESIRSTVRHLAVPLFGSTFTTCLAFAPLALMPGPAGEFVGSIGISVIMAIAGSLFISLTIIPALVGIFRGKITAATPEGLFQFGIGNRWLYAAYSRLQELMFRRPWLGIAGGFAVASFGFLLLPQLPEQFFPPSDRNQFQVSVQLPPQSSIHETVELVRQARTLMLEEPGIDRVHWFVGESAPAFYYNMLPVRSTLPNYAQAMVEMQPGTDITALVRRVQGRLESTFPSAQIMARQLEQGPPVEAPIMIRVFGPDLETLVQLGDEIRLLVSQIPDVVSSVSELGSSTSRVRLSIDENQARLAGLSPIEIAGQLRSALDGEASGSLLEGTEVLPLRIRLNEGQRGDRRSLASFDLVSRDKDGNPLRVPVEAVADWDLAPGDATIERINGFRMNEIQVHVRAGVLASNVLNEFRSLLDKSGLQVPAGYSIDFAGESAERNRAVGNLLASAGVLGVMMVAGLVLSFQSFRLAALIGVVGLLSIGLGLQALWWFGYPFGFMAIVGLMGLVGVAINDSIVVLAALHADPRASRGDVAVTKSITFRATRHVLSTTLTTVAGFIPLIAGGGGFWPPLAVAIAGGVIGATGLALFFVPSATLLMFRPPSR
jgi:multidrug efflux pump subunit AcrB